jgi:hypothetical protein
MAQQQFMVEQDACPLMRSEGNSNLVFAYRQEPLHTYRWLVDPAGRVVEYTSFRRERSTV